MTFAEQKAADAYEHRLAEIENLTGSPHLARLFAIGPAMIIRTDGTSIDDPDVLATLFLRDHEEHQRILAWLKRLNTDAASDVGAK